MPQQISKKDKKHIRCLFLTKLHSTKSLYDFGLLTDDFTFYQCDIRTISKDLTSDLWLKLRHTFLPFHFDNNTDVVITNNISVYEPLAFYLKILQEQLFFYLRFIDRDQVFRRIGAFHPTYVQKKSLKQLSIKDMNKFWKKLLEYEKCPWITPEVNDTLEASYHSYQYRMKYLRLGIYYMIIKQHLHQQHLNRIESKKE